MKASLLYLHATAIMLARAVLFPYSLLYLQTTIGQPGCLKVINCAALMLICIYIIIQVFQEKEQSFVLHDFIYTSSRSYLHNLTTGNSFSDSTSLLHSIVDGSCNTGVSPPSVVPVCSHCALAIQSQEVWWTTSQTWRRGYQTLN